MNSPEIDEIGLAIEVLAQLPKELPAQYCRREARIPNNEGYDSIETHLHYELQWNLSSIDFLCHELRQWAKRLQRKTRRSGSRESTL